MARNAREPWAMQVIRSGQADARQTPGTRLCVRHDDATQRKRGPGLCRGISVQTGQTDARQTPGTRMCVRHDDAPQRKRGPGLCR
eukprot:53249-Eustigmatos_ZCMA.PRE.1